MPIKHVYFYLVLAIVIVGMGFGLKSINSQRKILLSEEMPAEIKTHSVGVPDIGGEYLLVNQNGNTVSNKTYLGKYVLMFFGYTFCPDFCPNTLTTFSNVKEMLGEDAKRVKPIFVTVDPLRDTPQNLKAYLAHFNGDFDGLTGNVEQIERIKKKFRIYGVKSQEAIGDKEDYLMDHSTISYLIGPDGKFITFFRYGADAEVIVTKLREYL